MTFVSVSPDMPAPPLDRSELTTRFPGSLNSNDFDLPSSTRSTLSTLLIVHPIAAFITLVMFVLAVVAHLHSPSHSAKYLLLVFIVGILDFLVCLLSFLVDVLLFVPHLAWGSYVVLAATILVALSGLISCAMRRTIVSRKARKKRIAANPEMSGENYYNRQAKQAASPVAASGSLQPTLPMLSGANGGGDTLPEFASFEKDNRSSDERIPLNHRGLPERSPGTMASDLTTTFVNDTTSTTEMATLRSRTTTPGSRDQYGNQYLPQDGHPMRAPSFDRVDSPGADGMPPRGYRGRGGYPGPGRGGYNGYGPPGNRGGYGPAGRGGYGSTSSHRGGYGPPPRGYGAPGMRSGRTPPPPGYHGFQGPYDRRPSAGSSGPVPYGSLRASPGPPPAPDYMNRPIPNAAPGGYNAYNPDGDDLPRAESPPPLPGIDDGIHSGQPVEMDATAGSPAHPPRGFGQFGIPESDSDVAGMLALQQARGTATDRHMSDASRYSQDE